MKVYRKKNGKRLLITDFKGGRFGGTEVVFLNYSLKGTLQTILNFHPNYEYLREPTPEEIEMFNKKTYRSDDITPGFAYFGNVEYNQ